MTNRQPESCPTCRVFAILAIFLSPGHLADAQTAPRPAPEAPATQRPTTQQIERAVQQVNEFLADLVAQEQKMNAGEAKTISVSSSFVDPATVLTASEDSRAVLPLLGLSTSWVPYVGLLGSQGLARLDCDAKYPHVVPLLRNEKWWIRRNAALVLGRSMRCGESTAAALITSLADDSWEVRMNAAWALGRHQVADSISKLQDLSRAQEGKQDGAEAAYAIKVIRGAPYKVTIRDQPLWLLVVDQDVPEQSMGGGAIFTYKGGGRAKNRFGYEYIETSKEMPLKLSFAQGILFYYGGNGAIKLSPKEKPVVLAGPYHPSVASSDK